MKFFIQPVFYKLIDIFRLHLELGVYIKIWLGNLIFPRDNIMIVFTRLQFKHSSELYYENILRFAVIQKDTSQQNL